MAIAPDPAWSGSEAEREQLCKQNIGLAQAIAWEYASRTPETYDDLIGPAMEGLGQAVVRYNDLRVPFPHFARNRVRGAVVDYLRGCNTIRVPRSVQRAVDNSEIKRVTGVIVTTGVDCDNIDVACPGETPDEVFERCEIAKELDRHVCRLGNRYRHAVVRRFYDEASMQEIADELGISDSRVSQLIAEAIREIRCRLQYSRQKGDRNMSTVETSMRRPTEEQRSVVASAEDVVEMLGLPTPLELATRLATHLKRSHGLRVHDHFQGGRRFALGQFSDAHANCMEECEPDRRFETSELPVHNLANLHVVLGPESETEEAPPPQRYVPRRQNERDPQEAAERMRQLETGEATPTGIEPTLVTASQAVERLGIFTKQPNKHADFLKKRAGLESVDRRNGEELFELGAFKEAQAKATSVSAPKPAVAEVSSSDSGNATVDEPGERATLAGTDEDEDLMTAPKLVASLGLQQNNPSSFIARLRDKGLQIRGSKTFSSGGAAKLYSRAETIALIEKLKADKNKPKARVTKAYGPPPSDPETSEKLFTAQELVDRLGIKVKDASNYFYSLRSQRGLVERSRRGPQYLYSEADVRNVLGLIDPGKPPIEPKVEDSPQALEPEAITESRTEETAATNRGDINSALDWALEMSRCSSTYRSLDTTIAKALAIEWAQGRAS